MTGRLNPNSCSSPCSPPTAQTAWGRSKPTSPAQIVARFNDVSTWQLIAPTETPGAQLLLEAENPRLVVATAPEVVFRSGPAVRIERAVGADGDLVTFTGVDDLVYLRHRLAHPQPASGAPPYHGRRSTPAPVPPPR